MSASVEINISGENVLITYAGTKLAPVPLEAVVEQIVRCTARTSIMDFIPRHVRFERQLRDATALAIEVPPHARTVRWIAPGSKEGYGPGTRYRLVRLSFPYIVLLVVIRRGEPTGLQQVFYRREPLEAGGDLLYTNLPNVARAYGQRSWLCFQHLPNIGKLSWTQKVDTMIDHIFSAAFNRSADEHEGNSYWGSLRPVDPRVATLEDWEKNTKERPLFALDVPWRPAGVDMETELERMLGGAVKARKLATAGDLAGLVRQSVGRRKRAR